MDVFVQVLSGVRTGCPLSATLFLLALNPFIDLFNYLSDGPKLSRSCMCADDVGSALRALKHLTIQHSIFKCAAKTSGMILKPSKCYIIISVVELTNELKSAVQAWLLRNIPDWKDFKVVAAGKYLGVFLGRDSRNLTFKALAKSISPELRKCPTTKRQCCLPF